MYNFSNEAKTRVLSGKVTRGYLKVLATDTKPEMIIDENNYLKDCTFEELRYVPNEGFIGGTVAKRVTGNFNNVDSSFSIQDREFELYLGVDLEDGTAEYIKYGTFIVQKPEDDQVNDNTSFEALDYMIKLNLPWVDRMTYPCTLKELFDDLVAQSGLSTKVTSFLNQNFIVENNQFEEGTTRRDVLKAIAQMAFNWARIDEDDEIVMDFIQKDNIDETLSIDNYYNFSKQDVYGPINTVILRNSQVEGENITIRDAESIEKYGKTELVISDNPFAYTQAKRTELIEAAKSLFGLTYIPMTVDTIGYIYLNCKDKIRVQNLNENNYDTYLLNHTINYDGTASDTIESPAMTKTETQYQFTPDVIKALKRTEIIVDKNNQTIQALVTSNTELVEKTSKLEIDVDSIKGQISDVADVTITSDGYGTLNVENINQSEPIMLRIYPTAEDIIPLRPNIGLQPHIGLRPHKRELIFTRTNKEDEPYSIEYNLPTDLYKLNNYYDEFVLDYENRRCYVNRNIGIDENGEKYILEIPTIEEYEYPTLQLLEGDYKISLPAFPNAYIYVRLMTKNLYTSQFATKVELGSKLEQTSSEINLNVSKTYQTKTDAQTQYSQIKQTTDNITTEVSKKVGNNEVISKINQSSESIQIDANKISLKRKRN